MLFGHMKLPAGRNKHEPRATGHEAKSLAASRVLDRWVRWAAGADAKQNFQVSMELDVVEDRDGVRLSVALTLLGSRSYAALKPAYELLEQSAPGLGMHLMLLLDRIDHRIGSVVTPVSLFEMATHFLYLGCATDADLVQELHAYELEDDAIERRIEYSRPSLYWQEISDDFGVMPLAMLSRHHYEIACAARVAVDPKTNNTLKAGDQHLALARQKWPLKRIKRWLKGQTEGSRLYVLGRAIHDCTREAHKITTSMYGDLVDLIEEDNFTSNSPVLKFCWEQGEEPFLDSIWGQCMDTALHWDELIEDCTVRVSLRDLSDVRILMHVLERRLRLLGVAVRLHQAVNSISQRTASATAAG